MVETQRRSSAEAVHNFKHVLKAEVDHLHRNVLLAFQQATSTSPSVRDKPEKHEKHLSRRHSLGTLPNGSRSPGKIQPIIQEESLFWQSMMESASVVSSRRPSGASLGSRLSTSTRLNTEQSNSDDCKKQLSLTSPSCTAQEDDDACSSFSNSKGIRSEDAWQSRPNSTAGPAPCDANLKHQDGPAAKNSVATLGPRRNDDDAFAGEFKMVKVLDVWARAAAPAKHGSQNISRTASWVSGGLMGRASSDVTEFSSEDSDEEDEYLHHRMRYILRRMMICPNSKAALIWEFISLAWISWDILMIPFQAFDPEMFAVRLVMLLIMSTYWTLDILVSFFIGFTTDDGTITIKFSAVAKRYAFGRCPLDLALVTCSWAVVCMEVLPFGREGESHLKKVSKAISVVLLLRLHRLVHLWRLVEKMFIQVRGEARLILVYMSLVVVIFVTIIHLMGCLWFWVSDGDWASPSDNLADVYIQSVHVVLALFVGEHVMAPRNFGQRLFMVFVLLFGFIISAALVGSLTTAMTRLQLLARQRSALFASLNRFLSDHAISGDLVLRINRNARHALTMQQLYIQESNVELLALVSAPLRAELHYEIYSILLLRHPFLALFNMLRPRAIQSICDSAVSYISLSSGDILFSATETPERPCMFVCRIGSLHYSATLHDQRLVEEHDFISEAALWAVWQYQGTMKGYTESQLLSVDAIRFSRILRKTELPHARQYAIHFVKRLNALEHSSDIGLGVDECRRLACHVFEEEDDSFNPPMEWNIPRRGRRSSSRRSTYRQSIYSVAGRGSRFSVQSLRKSAGANATRAPSIMPKVTEEE